MYIPNFLSTSLSSVLSLLYSVVISSTIVFAKLSLLETLPIAKLNFSNIATLSSKVPLSSRMSLLPFCPSKSPAIEFNILSISAFLPTECPTYNFEVETFLDFANASSPELPIEANCSLAFAIASLSIIPI